jgi:hypothetical protein
VQRSSLKLELSSSRVYRRPELLMYKIQWVQFQVSVYGVVNTSELILYVGMRLKICKVNKKFWEILMMPICIPSNTSVCMARLHNLVIHFYVQF